MQTPLNYKDLLADIDDSALSKALVELKHNGESSKLTAGDQAVLARLILLKGRSQKQVAAPSLPAGIEKKYMLRAEMIAAGKIRDEVDRKGHDLYLKLLEEIDRKNGCRCGYGSRLRGVKIQVAHFLKNLDA